MFIFLLVTIFVYIIINGRNLEFYLNYYKNSPLFNNYIDINFFQSYSGTKQFSIFWYLDYWFTSGSGIIISTLSILGLYLFLSSSNYKDLKLKLFFLSIPFSIIIILTVHQVVADRYSFGLIPFIIFFSSISLKRLYFEKKLLNKIIFFSICSFLILKITIWTFTFFQDSTRLKSINWINANIPKGSGIIFYDMYDWNSKVFNELNQNYSVWQYISPILNIDDVEQLSRLGYEYYLHGETGFQNYYPEIRPYLKDKKNAYHMKKKFENFYSNFIRKTDLKATFYNTIYESGLFHSKGYDTSNYLKDVYQPVLQISKIKENYLTNNYFIFDANALSKKKFDIFEYKKINYLKMNKNEDYFYFSGPYETLPVGKYKSEINFLNLHNIDVETIVEINILNKKQIIKKKLLIQEINYKYELDFNINELGKNQIEFYIQSPTDQIFIKDVKIKKI